MFSLVLAFYVAASGVFITQGSYKDTFATEAACNAFRVSKENVSQVHQIADRVSLSIAEAVTIVNKCVPTDEADKPLLPSK